MNEFDYLLIHLLMIYIWIQCINQKENMHHDIVDFHRCDELIHNISNNKI